ELEDLGRQLGLAGADLEALAALEQRREHELAERPHRDHTPRDGDALRIGGECGRIALAEALAHRRERLARPDARRFRVHAGGAESGELGAADVALAHSEGLRSTTARCARLADAGSAGPPARHSSVARMNRSRSPSSTPPTLPISVSVR